MLGNLIRLVTLPVDAASATFDVVSGGNGSKQSRMSCPNPVNLIEEVRDAVANTADDIGSIFK